MIKKIANECKINLIDGLSKAQFMHSNLRNRLPKNINDKGLSRCLFLNLYYR